jgi:hypothetical protein
MSWICVYTRIHSIFLFFPIIVTTVTCVCYSHDDFPCAGNISQESAFHRPVASTIPSQRCSLRNSPRWSSARYRGPELSQQGLHTPVPVVLKYYTTPSNVVAPTTPMCYRWKMFAENWPAFASNRHSTGSVTKQVLGLVPMEGNVLWSVNQTEGTA